MDLGINGRRALVAASSQGLGRETARALLEAGCEVVVSGRDAGRLDEAVADIGGGTPIVADLSSAEAGVALVEQAADALGGGLDILVTNNGGPPPGNFASTDIEAPRVEEAKASFECRVTQFVEIGNAPHHVHR